jgi:pyruvate,water dikinase
MSGWWWNKDRTTAADSAEDLLRSKYASFRELLSLNSECLELLASVQEDLQDVPPLRDLFEERIGGIFEKAEGIVAALEKLSGKRYHTLATLVRSQRNDVERYIAARQELATPRLSAWLPEIDMSAVAEAGSKAAALGEVKNRAGLAVPDGFVLTTEAYRQFCGVPLWRELRDALRHADLNDLDGLRAISANLRKTVMQLPLPRAIQIAITERAAILDREGKGLAVRSSAVGEGGERTFAGQFLSLINVPPARVEEAYRRVVASRFSERALFYRLSTGLSEVDSPMAVLFLPVIRARAAGIMYTRDPKDARSEALWITSTRGLGMEIASGRMPADLFVVSRRRSHEILEHNIVEKAEEISVRPGGGLERSEVDPATSGAPSLEPGHLRTLAAWGMRLESHFKCPQDVEWAIDEQGNPWVLQSRPLAVVEAGPPIWSRAYGEPVLSGGRTVYPGQASGKAYLVEDSQSLNKTPQGAILFLRRASPEIVEVFPRIGGLVAEWGNITGHAAALLREFKVPSVFQMTGVFKRLKTGDPVSLDAVQQKVYPGMLWPPRKEEVALSERYRQRAADPISRRLLQLNLVDPTALNFRPGGCKSTHDVLRFCHEKAIEAMFNLNDREVERGLQRSKRLLTPMPVNLYVLDLGGGLAAEDPGAAEVRPEHIVSRPFQGFWKGVTHPGVTWSREMPASLGDLASVMAGSLSSSSAAMRALGEKSYLLVADEYMNLNSRLAYHFTLLDACVSDVDSNNYISFRFAGGGATWWRRNLRTCFIEACLNHYGFLVDRRGDVLNAWFKKAAAEETETKLDILGRLMACASQLDMYMTSHDTMQWYVRQFLEGNYSFRPEPPSPR